MAEMATIFSHITKGKTNLLQGIRNYPHRDLSSDKAARRFADPPQTQK
jgi:hypothetical protein